jgi:oligoendopeptidase F
MKSSHSLKKHKPGLGDPIMFDKLPRDAAAILGWSWPEISPLYSALEHADIVDASGFLEKWTRVTELVEEIFSRLHVATTVNTADKDAEKRYHDFLDSVFPQAEQSENNLRQKFIKHGAIPAGFEIPFKIMKSEVQLFREQNLPLFVQERKLEGEYDKIIGSQTIQWDGKELTVSQVRPFLQVTDRHVREEAWRASLKRQLKDCDAIGALWKEFLAVRLKMASNADCPDYRAFRWRQFNRFDYTPQDCLLFHKAIEETVVPAAARICETRKKLLGIDSLRPWDLDVDPLGRPPLKPFRTSEELIEKSSVIFRRIDDSLGKYFETMVTEGLIDPENRKNKAPGGYCTEFAASKRPFIFMNAVGIHDDVQTLLHEAGHCFHTFEKGRLPFIQQRQVSMEFSEVASMSMELLASPLLASKNGGFYSDQDFARARIEHLERSIMFWPYMAAVDAFQHWVYENPEDAGDPDNCDKAWDNNWERFMSWIDWKGLEQERMTGWQRKLHIHTVPFYYVEYGLAQLGAVQVWGRSLEDRTGAVTAYRHALALGGTVDLPSLYAAAGAKFAFDSRTLGEAVAILEANINSLRKTGEDQGGRA